MTEICQLLASMPDNYHNVTTALDIYFCQNQKSVTLDFVKSRLLQEEIRQTKNTGQEVSQVFVAQKKKYSQKHKFPFKCFKCGVKGHKNRTALRIRRALQKLQMSQNMRKKWHLYHV